MQYETYHFDNSIHKQLHTLSELDNWHGLLALLEDYSLIGLSAIATCSLSWYLYPLAILIIGSRQRALATLLHEASHRTLAKNKYLNFALGTFFSGYLILQNMGSYRESHVRFHHGHFGDPNLDPDYQFALQQNLYDKTQTPIQFIIQNIVLPCFLVKVPNYLYSLFQSRLLDKSNRKELVGTIAYLGILTAIFTSLGWGQYIILFWVVPYLTTFQIIGWFIELGEHYPLMNNKINLYMTRNRHGHWLEKLFAGMHNESYHLVHHLNPKIPFWNVAKAHKIYLQDENYAQCNRQTGGLFLSANSAPTILKNAIARVHSQWVMTQQLTQ